jgi:hypothetical protein
MTWNNMPRHHSFNIPFTSGKRIDLPPWKPPAPFFFGLWSHELHFCHNMPWEKNYVFLFFFFNFFFFDTILKHDAHVCVLIIMYMFVNCICARYIKACIYQGLNPRLHGNTLRSSPPNHFDTLWIIKIWKSVTLSCLAWNCLGNSNATNENIVTGQRVAREGSHERTVCVNANGLIWVIWPPLLISGSKSLLHLNVRKIWYAWNAWGLKGGSWLRIWGMEAEPHWWVFGGKKEGRKEA